MIPGVIALAAHGIQKPAHATASAADNTWAVSLQQEVESLRDINVVVAPNAMDARVPALFVQLLVQNALWQLRRSAAAGSVSVSAQRDGDELKLEMRVVMPYRAG